MSFVNDSIPMNCGWRVRVTTEMFAVEGLFTVTQQRWESLKEYFQYGCAELRCAAIVSDSAALRIAIDIETQSAFLYLSQRAAQLLWKQAFTRDEMRTES